MCEDTVMKLFNQLLVAPAALGLLAPLSAIASEVNISEMATYTDIDQVVEEEIFDHNTFTNSLATNSSTENNFDIPATFEAGGFSDTTVMNGKAIFDIGGVENTSGDLAEAIGFQYTYQLNLNTSFTGDDDLYVRLKSGNATDTFSNKNYGTYLSSSNAVKVSLSPPVTTEDSVLLAILTVNSFLILILADVKSTLETFAFGSLV